MKLNKAGCEHQANIEVSWMQINLGTHLHGKISGSQGQRFLEADMNQPRWVEVGMLASSIARAIEQTFGLVDQVVQPRMRYVEMGNDLVQPQVHLRVHGRTCDDKGKLMAVVAQFGAKTTASADLYDVQKYENLQPADEAIVSEHANGFLQANGAKHLSTSMQFVVDALPVATIAGFWRGGPTADSVEPTERTFEGLYDGRRLRTRTLYLFVTNPRTRSIEIYYDEEQFDAQLRELGEDKNAMLSVTLTETINQKKQARYELVSLTRLEPPANLELS